MSDDPRVPAYTTTALVRDDLQDHLEPEVLELPADEAELGRLIARAEGDVDRAIGGPFPAGQARKLDPDALTAAQRAALERAVAAQVAFRVAQGERVLIGSDDLVIGAGDLRFANRPYPRLSPHVAETLAGHGLIRATRTAAATPESDDAAA